MKKRIAELIEKYEAEFDSIDWRNEEDFNPCDSSGGNFDDAYYMGTEHGEVVGSLTILYALQKELADE
jgi:hypothetical protein